MIRTKSGALNKTASRKPFRSDTVSALLVLLIEKVAHSEDPLLLDSFAFSNDSNQPAEDDRSLN